MWTIPYGCLEWSTTFCDSHRLFLNYGSIYLIHGKLSPLNVFKNCEAEVENQLSKMIKKLSDLIMAVNTIVEMTNAMNNIVDNWLNS